MPNFVHPSACLYICSPALFCPSVFLSSRRFSLHCSASHLLMSIEKIIANERMQRKQKHIPLDQGKENLVARAEIFDCGRTGSNVTSEQIVEDLGNVLLGLKLEPANVIDQQLQQVVGVHLLCQLSNSLWDGVVFYEGWRKKEKNNNKGNRHRSTWVGS